MTALESSIESLTAEHTALTEKLEQIDRQYRVERPVVVGHDLLKLDHLLHPELDRQWLVEAMWFLQDRVRRLGSSK